MRLLQALRIATSQAPRCSTSARSRPARAPLPARLFSTSPTPSSSSAPLPPLRFRASASNEWYTITDASPGETLKDIAKRHALPSIEATCGGACECATCHAYIVSPSSSSDEATREGEGPVVAPDLDVEPPEEIFPARSEAEDDMLDYAIDRRASSRLTCQVTYTPEMAEWLHKTRSWIELPRL
ncbi:hypothetical protein V8E36_005097 [Tilletia maclaganii]